MSVPWERSNVAHECLKSWGERSGNPLFFINSLTRLVTELGSRAVKISLPLGKRKASFKSVLGCWLCVSCFNCCSSCKVLGMIGMVRMLFAVLGVLMITPLCRFSGSGRGKSFRRRPCDIPPNLFPLCVPLQTGGEAEEYCFAVSLVFSDGCH